MADPVFLLQIVDAQTGQVIQLPGGGLLEANFLDLCTQAIASKGLGSADLTISLALQQGINETIDACVGAIVSRGVGIARTAAHVAQDIRDGLREVLTTNLMTHRQIAWNSPDAHQAIRIGLSEALSVLKKQTRTVA